MLTAGYLLALWLGQQRDAITTAGREEAHRRPRGAAAAWSSGRSSWTARSRSSPRSWRVARDFLYLGRGLQYPIALEGALKLKEISYIHAEGYAGGEMKHGPIALIAEQLPVVALAPRDSHFDRMLSNMEQVRARDGMVIAVDRLQRHGAWPARPTTSSWCRRRPISCPRS